MHIDTATDERALARNAPKLDQLTPEALDTLARLATFISQADGFNRVRGWGDFSERERAMMRAGALRIMQAAVLLGWIELA